jgi:dihydroorotase
MTTERFDLVLVGGTTVFPWGIDTLDIGVKAGKITAIGSLKQAETKERWDVTGLHVLPGLIDSQVHFREPGLEHKEDLESGTRGAMAGGITCVFEMPNTNPPTTTVSALQDKLTRAKGRCWTHYAFYAGMAEETLSEIPAMESLQEGVCGSKLFMGASTGSLLVDTEEGLRRSMLSGQRLMAIHAEDNARMTERKHLAEAAGHPSGHPLWRDEQSAYLATERALRVAKETGRKVHLLHITTAEEMELLAQHRDVASVEVLPQHLVLSAPECYERLGTLAQMNPPIRDKRHQQALWHAVQNGLVDVMGSDHAPHTLEEKHRPYPQSPSGLTGVQTMVPLMLDQVNQGKLSLMRLVDLLAHGPQRVFQIKNKGRLVLGYDADFTLVDLKQRRTIENRWIQSRVGWTPFDGMAVTGWPVATVLGGQPVMKDDQLLGKPQGQPVRFWDV